jgi:hypothetical protein
MTPVPLVAAVAAHGLHPSNRGLAEKPLNRREWDDVANGLQWELLAALALEAVRGDILPVTPEQRDEVERMAASQGQWCDAVARCLVETATTLEGHAIETRFLHGAVNAALDYATPRLRLYDAVHVVVAPMDLREAVAVLERNGLHREVSRRRRPRGRRRGACLVTTTGIRVELRCTLASEYLGGSIDPSVLFATQEWFEVQGVKLSTLAAEERFITACMRARVDGAAPQLFALRDVVQLALSDKLSMRTVEQLAAAWRMEAVMADALRRAWQTFNVSDVVPISSWSSSYRPTRRDLRRLAVAQASHHSSRPKPAWATERS